MLSIIWIVKKGIQNTNKMDNHIRMIVQLIVFNVMD